LTDSRFLQFPEHWLIEQLVLQGEFLKACQSDSIVVPSAVGHSGAGNCKMFVDFKWRQCCQFSRVELLTEPHEPRAAKGHCCGSPVSRTVAQKLVDQFGN
jgi:hypothetical protein